MNASDEQRLAEIREQYRRGVYKNPGEVLDTLTDVLRLLDTARRERDQLQKRCQAHIEGAASANKLYNEMKHWREAARGEAASWERSAMEYGQKYQDKLTELTSLRVENAKLREALEGAPKPWSMGKPVMVTQNCPGSRVEQCGETFIDWWTTTRAEALK